MGKTLSAGCRQLRAGSPRSPDNRSARYTAGESVDGNFIALLAKESRERPGICKDHLVLATCFKTRPIVLAIDIGSSSTRSALFNSKGGMLAKTAASEHYSIRYDARRSGRTFTGIILRAVNRCISASLREQKDVRSALFPSLPSGMAFSA